MKVRDAPWSKDDGELVHRVDRWTRYQWARFVEQNPSAQAELEAGAAEFYAFRRWARDVFSRLFTTGPERLEKIRPEDTWAVKLNDALDELPEVERLARRCRGDRVTAGRAALELAREALSRLPEQPSFEDPQPLRDEAAGLSGLMQQIAAGDDERQSTDLLEALRVEGRTRVQAALQFASELDPSDVRAVARSAAHEAASTVDALEAQVEAFSGWGRGAGAGMPTAQDVKAALAQRLEQSEKLQALAREAGRMRRIAVQKQKTRVDHGADEVSDIDRGADLARVLPTELGKLADPARFLEFARGLTERSLLQYRLRGKEALGRGPLVVCLDQSSSMDGDKEIWSKALALALLQVATMQRRTYRVLHFNEGVVRVDDWAPGSVAPLALVESMVEFVGGGTEFEPPLEAALEAIQREHDLKRADVVLVTDGEASVSADFAEGWRKARGKLGFTTYAVYVDAPGGVVPEVLETLADKTIGLADITQDTQATETLLGL